MAVTQEIGIPIDLSKGTFVNTEYKNGMLQLKELEIDDNRNSVYVEYGYWESDVIVIKDKIKSFKKVARSFDTKGAGQYKIYTKSSVDKITWSDYAEINYSDGSVNSPLGLYAMVKIEIYAAKNLSTKTVEDFDESGRYDNKYVNSSNGVLELKKKYVLNGELDTNYSTGHLFLTTVENSKYKKIDSLRVEV